jgi:hypothetical protein
LSVVGIVSSDRATNDLTRDVLLHQLQWSAAAFSRVSFPQPPDSQLVQVGRRALYSAATVAAAERLNELDEQVCMCEK